MTQELALSNSVALCGCSHLCGLKRTENKFITGMLMTCDLLFSIITIIKRPGMLNIEGDFWVSHGLCMHINRH